MEAHIASLDNLELGNLSQKLTNMRDKMRRQATQEYDYGQIQINGKQSEDSENNRQFKNFARQLSQNDAGCPIVSSQNNRPQSPSNQLANFAGPQRFINLEIAEKPIDFQEIKRLTAKKIGEEYWEEYIKCCISPGIVETLKDLFDKLQNERYYVNTKDFAHRVNRLGVKVSETPVIEVPIIKRRISLKKVLFQLYWKTRKLPESITWLQFKQAIQEYRFRAHPSIDHFMKSEDQKTRNYFNLPNEVVAQIKDIYLKSKNEQFLSYCPLSKLLARLQWSKIIQNNLHLMVRPKTNYEMGASLKETIQYITLHAPEFIDQDEFLLFFTVKGFTYYPIQVRRQADAGLGYDDSIDSQSSSELEVKKVRKHHAFPKEAKKKNLHFNEYNLSVNNPNSIRHYKLMQMLEEKVEQEPKQFKARPMPKSISKEKYEEFANQFQNKLDTGRQALNQVRSQSQRELQRLKKQTKLFASPKKQQIQHHYYQITARPQPQSTKHPKLADIQNEKAARRQKILSQTELKYRSSWQELPLVATLKESPKRSEHSPVEKSKKMFTKDIPDYRAEQLRIEQQLNQRRQQFHPTQPAPFHLHTEARHPKRQYSHISPQPYASQPEYDYKQILYSAEPEIYYTQKFADMVEANRKKIQQKQKKVNELRQEELQRQKRHDNFARFMKSNLMKIPDTAKICESQAKMKIERHRKYWKNLDREHQNNLNQLYAKILRRPFLYELQTAKPNTQPKHNIKNEVENAPKKSKKPKKRERRSSNRSL